MCVQRGDYTGPIEERDAVVAAEAITAMRDHSREAQHDLAVDLRTLTHCWNQAALAATMAGVDVNVWLDGGRDAPQLVVDLTTPVPP